MGDLLRWAAFSIGGGISATDTIDQFSRSTDIFGDVGTAGDGHGVTEADVLFNVVNNGSGVKLSGQTILNGVLMANSRTVDLSAGAIVNGEVAAHKIKLSGSSVIGHPPVISD